MEKSEILVFEITRGDEIDEPKKAIKMCSKLTFLFGEVCYDAATNRRAFSHQYTKMRRRMATKEEFLSEFWMFFRAKNDQRKYSKCGNQTYLWTSKMSAAS